MNAFFPLATPRCWPNDKIVHGPEPMTLLGAVKQDSGIWVAADSRHVSTFPNPGGDAWGVTVEKLYPLGDLLVWGWYGEEGGKDLEHYVQKTSFSQWSDFDQCLPKINQLRQGRVLGMMVAGYCGTEGKVLHLGEPLNILGSEDVVFCGACKMAAMVGWKSATAIDPTTDIERRFDSVMATVIEVSNHALEEPRVLWRITPDERVQVRSTRAE
jgi:hypothetical protein